MIISRYFSIWHPGSLLIYTSALAFGIILQWYYAVPHLTLVTIICLLSLFQIIYYLRKRIWVQYPLYILALCTGQYLFQNQYDNHEALFLLAHGKPVTIIGQITDITKLDGQQARYSLTIRTHSVQPQGDVHAVEINKNILMYTSSYPKNLLMQDLICLSDIKIKKPTNTSFDFYLMKENISCSTFITHQSLQLIERPTSSIARWIYYYKQGVLTRCRQKLAPQTFALFASVFLGNRTFYKKSMEGPKEDCKAWGISHYLARSGLHMVIFIFAWDYLLNLLPIAFIAKQIFLIFLSLFYCLLSWSSISFMRALISFVFYKTCIMLKVPGRFLHLLMLTCFIVLLSNPSQLFFLDFQLSFGLTFALAWFNHTSQLNKIKNIT